MPYSDGSPRWDNRRSGRTTKMLADASAHAYHGRECYVIMAHGTNWDYMRALMKDLATKISNHARVAEVNGTNIYFVDMADVELNGRLIGRMVGRPQLEQFWDHEALRKRYNHIFELFHRYD